MQDKYVFQLTDKATCISINFKAGYSAADFVTITCRL